MPLKGRQRTEGQKAQTAALHKRRLLPKSSVKADAIDPASSRLLSKERKKHKEELEKIRRSEYNARRSTKRAEGKLKEVQRETQTRIEEAAKATIERCEGTLKELRREKESLKKELARLEFSSSSQQLSTQLWPMNNHLCW